FDIVGKKLLENSLMDFFREIIGVEIQNGEIIEELPQERPVMKRTDYPVMVTDVSGQKSIYIVELQTHWSEGKLKDLIIYRFLFERKYNVPVQVVLVLFLPHKDARDVFKASGIRFEFRLVKLYEMNAQLILERKLTDLYPLTPLPVVWCSLAL
ncbi:MAG: hypothetical protein Q9M13_04805, partial [Mariprofundales bacterium]|nr:hypothetical protein [Mariprofundales bacterium]